LFVIGTFLSALGFNLFISPYNIVTGGSTGIALIVKQYFNINISLFVLIINILFMILSFVLLGKRETGKSIIGSLLFPFFLTATYPFVKWIDLSQINIVAIILATVISSLSEYGSEKAFQKLSKSTSNILVKVIRDSVVKNVSIEEVVKGDYVYLESGDKVPADGVIYNGSVYIDESMLSGETKEQYKSVNKKVYRGSVVVNGSGVFIVTGVGNETYYGKIAKDIQEKTPDSPLKNRLRVLGAFISKIGYICAFLVIVSYLFNVVVVQNNFDLDKIKLMLGSFKTFTPHLLYSLTLGITIIVVAVPEGLPMMITLVLSSNMKRLLKENVLVRKLVSIEEFSRSVLDSRFI
jgi:magnesium-transporting ATPase (P-type)